MPEISGSVLVGERIRRIRQRRGLTQQVAAELAGVSQAYLSLIENGHRILDRRSTGAAIARALRVSIADLTGQWWPDEDPVHADASARMSEVRFMLMDADITNGAEGPALPLDQLEAEHERLLADTVACRLPAAADRLVTLLPQAHAALNGPDRARALRLVVEVCQRGYLVTRRLSFFDLAYVMTERAVEAAKELGDATVLAAAQFDHLAARMHGGGYVLAQRQAVATADSLGAHLSVDGPDVEVAGMLHLAAAMCAAVTGDRARAGTHQQEAKELAARTGDRTGFGFFFGPGNVAIWSQALALEAGEPDQALRLGQNQLVKGVKSVLRQSNYHADRARALHLLGDHQTAVREVTEAERLAPLWAPRDEGLRGVVSAAYRERRRTDDPELDRTARRFGVTEAG